MTQSLTISKAQCYDYEFGCGYHQQPLTYTLDTTPQSIPSVPISELISTQSSTFSHFRISSLPLEIQHHIYRFYFSALAPLELTTANAGKSLHLQTSLPLILAISIPREIYYTHATFSLSSYAPIEILPRAACTSIRRIRVSYGKLGKQTPEWAGVLQIFPSVVELVFVVELIRLGAMVRDGWCECVRETMKNAIYLRGRGGILVRVECGKWGFEEWIGQKQ